MKKSPILLLLLFAFISHSVFAQIQLEEFVSGFSLPVDITNAGDDRLFIVEQSGKIYIIDGNENILPTPFIDISNRVNSGGEKGLLGLAFDPDYTTNGWFYLSYTASDGGLNSRISRFRVDPNNPNAGIPSSEQILLSLSQPYSNHNGGDIAFGPDGYLYAGYGDGGSGGDPQGYSQNTQSLLGKMLRLDVSDGTDNYSIPADNPFVGNPNVLDEIWATGVRNPWRFSFDKNTGDLWIGDVGQNEIEEVDFQPAGSAGGENYGWNCKEGNDNYWSPSNACNGIDPSTLVAPAFEYDQSNANGCSITGGFVYRGCRYPSLKGLYIFADYCSGRFWSVEPDGAGGWNSNIVLNSPYDISTFGEGNDGELYAAQLFGGGTIYRVTGGTETTVNISEDTGLLTASAGFDTYQWYLDGAIIPNETNMTYQALVSGDYNVESTNGTGTDVCNFTSNTLTVIVSNTNELAGLSRFEISPNPFSDAINFVVELEEPSEAMVKVIDVEGKVVFTKEYNISGLLNTSINLENLATGIYFLELQTAKGNTSRKIVKQ